MINIVRSSILSRTAGVCAGVSTRNGGVSAGTLGLNLSFRIGDLPEHVNENRRRFFEALPVDSRSVAFPLQCHSTTVKSIDAPGEYPECDALITSRVGIALAITVADCIPILLFDQQHRAVSAVHAGWRGSAGRIVQKALTLMRNEFDTNPQDALAFIGPGAHSCCYMVGRDAADQFPAAFRTLAPEAKSFIALPEYNKQQLVDFGVPPDAIEIHPHCTICNKSYHSYRRDGDAAGRMLAVIAMHSQS